MQHDLSRYLAEFTRRRITYSGGSFAQRNFPISKNKAYNLIMAIDEEVNVAEIYDALVGHYEAKEARRKELIDSTSPTTLEDAVRGFIRLYEIKATATGSWQSPTLSDLSLLNGYVVNLNEEAKKEAARLSAETGEKIKPIILQKNDAKDILEMKIGEYAVKKFHTIRESVRFDKLYKPRSERTLKKLCKMLAGNHDDDVKYGLVLYQFMWNVKRKLMQYEALDHIVPYFYSPQGCGKTTLIRKIMAPLDDLAIETDIEKLTERFSSRILENFYIVHLEESAKAGKSPIECVKSLITQSHTANRDMHTQLAKKRRVNISPVVSSNNPLRQMFRDFTGMRRFYEIKHGMLDFDLVNSIDYDALWIGIDEENDVSPFRRNPQIYSQIMAEQDLHRSKNTVEIFLTEMGFLPCKPSNSTWYTGRDIFSKFRRWAEENCDRKADIQMFNTQINYLYPTVLSQKGLRDVAYLLHRDGGSAKMIDPDNDFAAASNGGQGFEELE